MKITSTFLVVVIICLSLIAIPSFANDTILTEEIRCTEGGTITELQNNMNRVIQELSPWTSAISAPSMLLKHSGLENPYVMCVAVKYKLGF